MIVHVKTKVAPAANKYLPSMEHGAFVAYSACEVFALHGALYFVSLFLLISGGMLLMLEIPSKITNPESAHEPPS